MKPRETVTAFDHYLQQRGLAFEATIVGGSALGLMGVTDRQTRDVDVLDPDVPESIARASASFAREQRASGVPLADDWLNNGPAQLKDVLPEGWDLRIEESYVGSALKLSVLGRADLLKSKLFALCDRGTDLRDCIALAPTSEELAAAEDWVAYQDANPLWPDHVRRTLEDLKQRLNHGLP